MEMWYQSINIKLIDFQALAKHFDGAVKIKASLL